MDAPAEIRAELDRVGAGYPKAGASDYVQVVAVYDDEVELLGPPRLPRHRWRGSVAEALSLLSTLTDDAGPEAFWAVFEPNEPRLGV